MIKKTKLGNVDGYLYETSGKGFFIARTKGAMPNGTRWDKVTITGTYDQSGVTKMATKKLAGNDVHRGRTIATATVNTKDLPQLIQALTMLAMELGSGAVPRPPASDVPTTPEQRAKDEVDDFLQEHGGKVFV